MKKTVTYRDVLARGPGDKNPYGIISASKGKIEIRKGADGIDFTRAEAQHLARILPDFLASTTDADEAECKYQPHAEPMPRPARDLM